MDKSYTEQFVNCQSTEICLQEAFDDQLQTAGTFVNLNINLKIICDKGERIFCKK